VPHNGEAMFVHGMGGFAMWEYIGESAFDILSGSRELTHWCFPLSANVEAMALDKLPAN